MGDCFDCSVLRRRGRANCVPEKLVAAVTKEALNGSETWRKAGNRLLAA